ncbi:MAG: hypothetical protein ABI333_12995 [bacterium]
MKRNLLLLTTCVALLALSVGGCKKKPKEPKAPADDMQAMAEAMEAKAEAMEAKAEAVKAVKAEAMRPAAKADAPAAGGEITFTKKMTPVGTKIAKIEKMNMHFTLEAQGRQIKFTNASTEVKNEEILALKGNIVTKLKVHFKTMQTIAGQGDKSKTTNLPIEGKTYVLEAKDGEVIVTDDAGKPVDAKINKAVRKEFKTFGKPNKMFEAIPTTPIKVGARVESLEKALQASFKEDLGGGKGEQWSLTNVTVALKEIQGKLALFAVTVTITMNKGPQFSMTMNMKGVVTVDTTTGMELASTIAGPLDVMGKKNAGQMSVVETKTYSK